MQQAANFENWVIIASESKHDFVGRYLTGLQSLTKINLHTVKCAAEYLFSQLH